MKERPILFTPINAAKIFSGQKTQTRRVITPQPSSLSIVSQDENDIWGELWYTLDERRDPTVEQWRPFSNRFGLPGDRLWIREAFKRDPHNDCIVFYRDGSVAECRRGTHQDEKYVYDKWRSAMFMPRWACRTVVEITEIRVERVQSISEEDALAEGVSPVVFSAADIADIQISDASPDIKELARILGPGQFTAKHKFHELWDSINGECEAKSWRGNPWVWCISFKKLEG